jgi:hypothetical protein
MNPAWVGLIGVVVGGSLSATTGLVTSWISDRRRYRREDELRSIAERREDELRLIAERQKSYLEFLETIDRISTHFMAMTSPGGSTEDAERELQGAREAMTECRAAFVGIQVWGSAEVRALAFGLSKYAEEYNTYLIRRRMAVSPTALRSEYYPAREILIATIRDELGVSGLLETTAGEG